MFKISSQHFPKGIHSRWMLLFVATVVIFFFVSSGMSKRLKKNRLTLVNGGKGRGKSDRKSEKSRERLFGDSDIDELAGIILGDDETTGMFNEDILTLSSQSIDERGSDESHETGSEKGTKEDTKKSTEGETNYLPLILFGVFSVAILCVMFTADAIAIIFCIRKQKQEEKQQAEKRKAKKQLEDTSKALMGGEQSEGKLYPDVFKIRVEEEEASVGKEVELMENHYNKFQVKQKGCGSTKKTS